jgi:hypothetical protein
MALFRRTAKRIFPIAAGILMPALSCLAQTVPQPGTPPAASAVPSSADASLAESVRQLERQVKDLRAELAGLRREMTETRGETRLLRQDLADTRIATPASGEELASAAPSPGQANSETSTGQNISDRLAKIEEDQQLLTAKVDDQYQTKVESGSRYRVRFSGMLLTNFFSNSSSVNNQDFPSMATPSPSPGYGGDVGATVRQSELGLDVTGPSLWGAQTSANIQFDFAGGFADAPNGVSYGIVRLRTASMRLDWGDTSLLAGQDTLFVSPLSPSSIASLAIPALSYAGNLWDWTPEIMVEHRVAVGDGINLKLQAGILDSLDGEIPYNEYYRAPTAGENSRQPAYATHVSIDRQAFGHQFSIGAGGYYGRQNWGAGHMVDSWAATADALVPLPWHFELSGEFYRGRALGGLGGGVGQSIVTSGPLYIPDSEVEGLDSAGGWGQLKFRATPKLEFNGAYGVDSPFSSALREYTGLPYYNGTSVARNAQTLGNFIFRPRSDLLFSLEYRRLFTVYIPEQRYSANVINLSLGVLF